MAFIFIMLTAIVVSKCWKILSGLVRQRSDNPRHWPASRSKFSFGLRRFRHTYSNPNRRFIMGGRGGGFLQLRKQKSTVITF